MYAIAVRREKTENMHGTLYVFYKLPAVSLNDIDGHCYRRKKIKNVW